MALNGGAAMQDNRLTLRFQRADHAAGGVSAADIGRLLIAVEAAIQACAASDDAASRRSLVRSLSLSSVTGQDSVLQLDFDTPDGAPLSRLVAAASAVWVGEPCEAERELRGLQHAIPQGVDAIQLIYGASSASISGVQAAEQPTVDDRWIVDLVDRMTQRAGKPFVPLSSGERLDFDVEEFNWLVAEGRRAGE